MSQPLVSHSMEDVSVTVRASEDKETADEVGSLDIILPTIDEDSVSDGRLRIAVSPEVAKRLFSCFSHVMSPGNRR